MPHDLSVEDIEVRLILEAIRVRYGYDLSEYMTASMHRRVLSALAKTDATNLGDLQHRLLTDPALFVSLLENLMVQVSDMFRDPPFFLSFRREIVPLLRTYPQLKIWHAGCASGEEVYTMAILLTEEGLYDRTQIYATDISLNAIEQAREGVYPVERTSGFADNYRAAGGTGAFDAYVSAAYDRVAIKEALRRNVVFFQHNLVSDQPPGEMQVIFCRNVLIYFGADLRRRVLAKFGDGLCRGGFLCLGMSEPLPVTPPPGDADRNADRDGPGPNPVPLFREHVAHQHIYRKA